MSSGLRGLRGGLKFNITTLANLFRSEGVRLLTFNKTDYRVSILS